MMNRQLRRAQAKMDKKADREKEERKDARRKKIAQLRERRQQRREEAKARAAAGKPAVVNPVAKSGRRAGRFSGALMIATVFFLVLQASVPPQPGDNELLRSITGAGFYLLFGYFSTLWLMRRGVPRPLLMTWITGAMLLVGVEAAKWVQGWVVPLDPLMLALALPGLVAGSFLGRLVYENTPA
jgi:hypothetical protein